MCRIFNVMLGIVLCMLLIVSYANAKDATPQWEEYLTLWPEWSWNNVGDTAYFDLYLRNGSLENQLIRFKVIEGTHVGISGSVFTDKWGYAQFSYTGTTVGYDRLLAWYDKDEDGTWDWLLEPGDFANVTWVMSPKYHIYFYWHGSGIIGSPAYLYVYLYDGTRNPIDNALIRFEVFDGPHVGVSGYDYTSYGYAEFSYTGTYIGEDDVVAWYDIDEDGIWDYEEGEVGDFVHVYWNPPSLWLNIYAASPPVGNEIYIQAEIWWWPWWSSDWWSWEAPEGFSVTLEVVSGPNTGLKKTEISDDAGIVSFTYTGYSVGVDIVHVYFTDYPEWYNKVYIFWMERLKFVKYELVSSEWKKPFYTAKLNAYIMNPTVVPNGWDPLYFNTWDVTAKISDYPTWTEVIQGEISFAGSSPIEPGETAKSDSSFSIKTDTSKVKDPKKGIVWCVMYYDYWGNMHVIADVPQLAK